MPSSICCFWDGPGTGPSWWRRAAAKHRRGRRGCGVGDGQYSIWSNPATQPIFAHSPAHADAAEDDPRCSHGKTADETCARCEHIADHLAPYEPSDDGIDDDGGYGGDFPGGILGTIMEGDSSDDDGGCMSARYNAAGTDETAAVTGKGSGRGGSRQGSGRKSVASGGSRNGEHSSKRPRGDHDSTNEASGETGAEASADAITDS